MKAVKENRSNRRRNHENVIKKLSDAHLSTLSALLFFPSSRPVKLLTAPTSERIGRLICTDFSFIAKNSAVIDDSIQVTVLDS